MLWPHGRHTELFMCAWALSAPPSQSAFIFIYLFRSFFPIRMRDPSARWSHTNRTLVILDTVCLCRSHIHAISALARSAFAFICVIAYAFKFPGETLNNVEFHLLTTAAAAAIAVATGAQTATHTPFVGSAEKARSNSVKWNENEKYESSELKAKKKTHFHLLEKPKSNRPEGKAMGCATAAG